MNAKEMAKITKKAKTQKEIEEAKLKAKLEESQRKWDEEKPARIEREYQKVLKLIQETAEKGESYYRYKGDTSSGILYMEVLPMLQADGFKVIPYLERREETTFVTTADGYDIVGTGTYYTHKETDIRW
jgi:hypothetical protein